MRILLLGGTGLISHGITAQLALSGAHEIVHANRGQSSRTAPDSVRQITVDRRDYDAFDTAVRAEISSRGRFDCVMEMIGFSPEDAHSLVRTFAGQTDHLIFCSTVDVYNKPAPRYPVTESAPYDRTTPWKYASDKVLSEEILLEAHARGDFPLTIIRPAHTYGEGSGLVHSLGNSNTYFDRLKRGKPIVVHGDGNSLWASCHRDDVARAFVNAIGQPSTFGNGYHTTSSEWLPWREYHRTVADAIGAPEPEFVSIPTEWIATASPRHGFIDAVNFQFNNIFDNAAAARDLGFTDTISLLSGVRRIYKWLVENGKIPDADSDATDDRLIAAARAAKGTFLETFASGDPTS